MESKVSVGRHLKINKKKKKKKKKKPSRRMPLLRIQPTTSVSNAILWMEGIRR